MTQVLRSYSRCIPLIFALVLSFVVPPTAWAQRTQPLIVDHSCTDITLIPESAIDAAKASLHIGYGHTSHGSQLTSGMTGLVAFANNGGLGLSLALDIFAWNNGGAGGALDLHDNAMAGDCGYYPQWVDNTVGYLGFPDPVTGRGTSEPDVNVIIWSWCGQVTDKYTAGTLESEYLIPMNQLEADYFGVTFVYMTGHLDYFKNGPTNAGNQIIRDYCIANNKVLYDFAEIECYDPDASFFEWANDNCDYYDAASGGTLLGNWATEWQSSHLEGVDWYDCLSAHSQPLNANRKAYAVWWLWAAIAGWNTPTAIEDARPGLADAILYQNSPNPFNPTTRIDYRIVVQMDVALKIYDVRGKEIRTLVDEAKGEGLHHAFWDGTDSQGHSVSSGLYFYRLVANGTTHTLKMILLR